MTEGPHRSAEAEELCAVCRAPTEAVCARCELPLCGEHLPTEDARCVGCEKPCEVCERPTPDGCRRCLRPVCLEHRHDKLGWCQECLTEWKEHSSGLRGGIAFVGSVLGVFTFGMVTMGGLAGLVAGGFAALLGGSVLVRWPYQRRLFELEERERVARQLPAGVDFRRDQ